MTDDPSSQWAKRPVIITVFLITIVLRTQMGLTSDMSSRIKERRVESSLSSSLSGEGHPCPPPDPAVDQRFLGYPQNHTLGKYTSEHGRPFLTQDFWFNIVDNRRTFFIRSGSGAPSPEQLKDWIQSRPHPISLVINNQVDKSFPPYLDGKRKFAMYMNETNLHAVYAGNARYLPEYGDKLQPIPIGLKFAFRSSKLFGEPKTNRTENFKKYGAYSPAHSEELFLLTNRTSTVYSRPMEMRSNRMTTNYIRDTPALKTKRYEISGIVNETAKHSIVFPLKKKMPQEAFFGELKKHRFVLSPPGNGLDTHATWEALLCGCIPIVPRSGLDRVFEDLPVWLVDNWEEVTDASVKEKEEYFLAGNKKYKWEKLYQSYWAERIYDGLCTV